MKIKLTLFLISVAFMLNSQTVADFESFSLPLNAFYTDTNNTPFTTSHASFMYQWTKGAFPYWSGGFSYTNKYDSATAGFTNIYGVKPLKGYNGSDTYVIAKDGGVIRLTAPQTTVNGFYFTNTTYAYKSMKHGDSFAKKFGDTTGTGSGTTIAQGAFADSLVVLVQGYRNGILKSQSVRFYLADFRFANGAQDYIVDTWQFVNTTSIGEVDSLRFTMQSSDMGQFGMNTPAFFGMDNFMTSSPVTTGVAREAAEASRIYPNPFSNVLSVELPSPARITICDLNGRIVYSADVSHDSHMIDTNFLGQGIYVLSVYGENFSSHQKISKP